MPYITRRRGFGDVPYPGTTPYTPSAPSGYNVVAAGDLWYQNLPDQTVNLPAATDVAYGANGNFLHATLGPGSVPCNEWTFGGSDPAPGIVKSCSVPAQGTGLQTQLGAQQSPPASQPPQTFSPSLNNTLQPTQPTIAQPTMPITQPPLPPVTQPQPPANPPATNYQPAPTSTAAPGTTNTPSVLPSTSFDLSILTENNWTAGLLPNWAVIAGVAGLLFLRR